MRSKRSLYNAAILRDDLRRTAPAWAGLTGFWLMALPLYIAMESGHYYNIYYEGMPTFEMRMTSDLCGMIANLVPAVSYIYGLAVAMLIFHTLYTNRSAVGIHALPVTRTQLFFNHWLAALLCAAVPTALVCLITAPLLAFLGAGNLSNLGLLFFVMVGSFIWNFSFAAFCAMFTGQIFWLPAFYFIVSVLPFAGSAVWAWLCDMTLFGYNSADDVFACVKHLCPGISMIAGAVGVDYGDGSQMAYITPGSMTHVAVYAAAGLVLALVTLALYKRRQLETAGEIVTYPIMRLVFRVGVAVCTGLVFMLILQELGGSSNGWVMALQCVPGAVAGMIIAQMLVKKSFRVLDKQLFEEGLCTVLGMAVVIGLLSTGGLGFETRIPKAEKVAGITLRYDGLNGEVGLGPVAFYITAPEAIEQAMALHKEYVEGGKGQEFRYGEEEYIELYDKGYLYNQDYVCNNLLIQYHLADGKTLTRLYCPLITRDMLEDPGSFASHLERFMQENLDLTDQLRRVRETAEISAWNYLSSEDEAAQRLFEGKDRFLEGGTPAAMAVIDTLIAELEYKGQLSFGLLGSNSEVEGEHWQIGLYFEDEVTGVSALGMNIISEAMPRTAYALATAPETARRSYSPEVARDFRA